MSSLLNSDPPRDRRSGSEPRERRDAEEEPALSLDAIFDVLRSSRRRGVITHLHETGEPADIGTLAEHIAAAENDIDREELTSTQRKRVYIALYQCHLPKMADYGVIEYGDRGTVALRPPARLLLPYIYLDSDRRPRRLYAPDESDGLSGWLERLVGR